jgi:uncharacterized Zn-binding protein involved in type VI secretion
MAARILEGSPTVSLQGQWAARQGDRVDQHLQRISAGSEDTYVNGREAARHHDPVDCSGYINAACTVFINNRPAAHVKHPVLHARKAPSGSAGTASGGHPVDVVTGAMFATPVRDFVLPGST